MEFYIGLKLLQSPCSKMAYSLILALTWMIKAIESWRIGKMKFSVICFWYQIYLEWNNNWLFRSKLFNLNFSPSFYRPSLFKQNCLKIGIGMVNRVWARLSNMEFTSSHFCQIEWSCWFFNDFGIDLNDWKRPLNLQMPEN